MKTTDTQYIPAKEMLAHKNEIAKRLESEILRFWETYGIILHVKSEIFAHRDQNKRDVDGINVHINITGTLE